MPLMLRTLLFTTTLSSASKTNFLFLKCEQLCNKIMIDKKADALVESNDFQKDHEIYSPISLNNKMFV